MPLSPDPSNPLVARWSKPEDGKLDELREWATRRRLLVRVTGVFRVGLYQHATSTLPYIERRGSSADAAAFYVINTLSRLGAGPNPWPEERT